VADNQQTGLQRSINRLIEQRIGLLEKEIEVRKKAGEQVSAAEKDVAKLRESQKKTNDVFEWGERIVKKYAASLTTLALAHRAYKIAVSSSRGETEHFIQSAQRLDSVSTSIKEIGRRAREYQEVVKNDIKLASRYGMELDKVKSVSDGWMKQQRFVDGYTREQQQSIRKLTELTIQYSKVLGVDASQLTQQAAKRMFQYGESAEEALHKIGRMRSNVEVLNATMSEHFGEKAAYLWVDDFSSLVNEAAGSTRGFIHDLDALSAAMAWSAEKATEAKLSYNQALNAAKAMGQFVTGGGNENAMSTILGLRFLEKIKKSRGPDGKLSEDFLAQFNESQRAELQKITSLIGTTNEKDLALYIADALASSKMGIRELLDLTNELGASSGDIVPILMQQRGLNRQQAIEIARQLKEAESLEAVAEGIAGQYKKAADENERMHSEGELKRLSRAEGGKVFAQLPYVDAVWERTDELIGGVKAHFADFGNVAKYALAGAALAAAGFVRSMGGIKGLTGTFAGIGNFGRSMATGGVGGMTSAAIASGTRQALLPYSAGGALRVMPIGGTMGAGGVGGRAGAAAAAGGGYYYAAGGGMGKKGYTAAQRAAIAREVGARRAGEMGIARGGAAAPAARAGMGARMGGLAKNPMTMLAVALPRTR